MNPAAMRSLKKLEQQVATRCAPLTTTVVLGADSAQIYIGYQRSHIVMRGTDEGYDDFEGRVVGRFKPAMIFTAAEWDELASQIEEMF